MLDVCDFNVYVLFILLVVLWFDTIICGDYHMLDVFVISYNYVLWFNNVYVFWFHMYICCDYHMLDVILWFICLCFVI